VATISVVRSGPVAFVGLYIVAPQFRGKGHGKTLWDAALSRRSDFTLGLDAVPQQVDSYASDGFVAAHENARFSADAGDLPAPDRSVEIRPASDVPFEELVEFDGLRFFAPRPGFLREWIAPGDRDAIVTVDRGEITGFAVRRPTSTGHRVGPVFATGPEPARAMIIELASRVSGNVAIDSPRPNPAAREIFDSLGMEPGFETTRMYRGQAPELPLDQIYGITTLELG